MKCLLSVSDQSFIRPVAPLTAEGVEFILSRDLETDWLSERVPDIDFLCAVLEGGKGSIPAAVFLEIGVALGREVPVLLVTDAPRDLPLALAGLQRVEVELKNREAIGQHIEKFAEQLKAKRGRQSKGEAALEIGKTHLALADRLHRLSVESHDSVSGMPFEYERLIHDVFAGAGAVSTVSQPDGSDGGFDLAVWVDGASEILGGPILVECKIGKRIKPGTLRRAAERLANVMYARSVNFGLIVYHDLSGADDLHSYYPDLPVWALSARELVEAVESGSLSRIITMRRNELMHGGRWV
ncbi:hypothetical protein [Streptomyces filamentosus]|uniref:hypothetical protein n=1 Tax=Streptomyces filamentosus TaxID=67294 RepID=UPI0037D1F764